MYPGKDRFEAISLVVLLAVLIASVSLGFVILRWPLAVIAGFILLTLLTFGSTFRSGRFEAALLCADPVVPVPSIDVEFHGIYTPHWEASEVRVLTGWRFFGLLPRFESWLPDGDLFRTIAGYHDGSSRSFVVHFRGIPSEVGRFGHMGSARRKVHIVALLGYFVMPKQSGVWS